MKNLMIILIFLEVIFCAGGFIIPDDAGFVYNHYDSYAFVGYGTLCWIVAQWVLILALLIFVGRKLWFRFQN